MSYNIVIKLLKYYVADVQHCHWAERGREYTLTDSDSTESKTCVHVYTDTVSVVNGNIHTDSHTVSNTMLSIYRHLDMVNWQWHSTVGHCLQSGKQKLKDCH